MKQEQGHNDEISAGFWNSQEKKNSGQGNLLPTSP